MTKPDLTNTAPKRIYLDIGDQFALERVASGSLRWDLLDGVTWSEDNATSHGIPYVRADLVPTPAASGAAPAEDGYATAFYEIASVLGIGARADTPENVFRSEMLPRIVALASREAGTAPSEQVERIVHLRAARDRRIYIAGPMTGLPEYNFPAFNAKAAELRAQGWHVENPAEHGHIEGAAWADYVRWDISRIATCGAIYLLPGWQASKGATLEVQIGRTLDLQFLGDVAALASPQVAPAPDPDPLQGAADWIKAGLTPCTASDIGGRLLIGYNRALRLFNGDALAAPAPVAPIPSVQAEPERRFVCSDCRAPLRHGYACDACGSDRADDADDDEVAPTPAQPSEDARDAARYRWLRDKADFVRVKEGSPQVCLTDEFGEIVSLLPSAYPRGSKLDQAIDVYLGPLSSEPEGEATPPALKEQQP